MIGHTERSDIDPNIDAVAAPPQPRTPEERLEASREAMRASLSEYYQRDRARREPGMPEVGDDEPGWFKALSDAMSDRPLVAIAMRWLRSWWREHPWRTLLDLSGEVLDEVVTPVARRHPWMLLGGAALIGVALSRLRPWRWISGGALLTGLLPQMSLASILGTITAALDSFHTQLDEEQRAPGPAEASDAGSAPPTPPAAGDVPPAAAMH